MATISLHRAPSIQSFHTDPLLSFRQFLNWDPFSDSVPRERAVQGAPFTPPFEVKETPGAFIVRADLPGVKDSDLDIKVVDDRLIVTGSRESEKVEESEAFHTFERKFGAFSRSFVLPDSVNGDDVKAELKQGVLTIALPTRPEREPKRISVATS